MRAHAHTRQGLDHRQRERNATVGEEEKQREESLRFSLITRRGRGFFFFAGMRDRARGEHHSPRVHSRKPGSFAATYTITWWIPAHSIRYTFEHLYAPTHSRTLVCIHEHVYRHELCVCSRVHLAREGWPRDIAERDTYYTIFDGVERTGGERNRAKSSSHETK